MCAATRMPGCIKATCALRRGKCSARSTRAALTCARVVPPRGLPASPCRYMPCAWKARTSWWTCRLERPWPPERLCRDDHRRSTHSRGLRPAGGTAEMTMMGNLNSHAVAVRPASYGHGTILASAADEARKSTQGRHMIRERVMALGKDSIYNLTGLVRTFPLQPQALQPLANQFTYYTHSLRRAEDLALHYTGADPHTCSAVLCNRVSAAMLAIMLGTLQPGDRVLSLVAQGRSHPSVQQAAEVMGATFPEVQGLAALE